MKYHEGELSRENMISWVPVKAGTLPELLEEEKITCHFKSEKINVVMVT